ncbi:hypothetical protein NUSPORA_02644 [Nucleospora cyclopteri]
MTKIIVYGPWGRLPVNVETYEKLEEKIKSHLKIEHCEIYKNKEKTEELKKTDALEEGMRLYIVSKAIQSKEVKANMCNHPKDKKCMYCARDEILKNNLETEKKPKYLSYSTYKTFLSQQGKQEEVYDYKIKPCSNHPSNVVCVNCMGKAITFMSQIYRKIDYVEFDSNAFVEEFINTWKQTGKQELGILMGKYKDVNETRRAVISAIYTPNQQNYPDGFHIEKLEENPFPSKITSPSLNNQISDINVSRKSIKNSINSKITSPSLNNQISDINVSRKSIKNSINSKQNKKLDNNSDSLLTPCGIIYTDLFIKDKKHFSYKVEKNFIISSYELEFFYKIMKQLKKNTDIVFICVTADEHQKIELKSFQLTSQFVSLMDASIFKLSTDPTVFTNNTKRDLLYMYRNEYNIDVSAKADEIVPVEYFFVTNEVGYSNNDPIFNNPEIVAPLTTLKKISGYFDGEYHNFHKYKNYQVLLSLKNFFNNTYSIYKAVVQNDEKAFIKTVDSVEFVSFISLLEKHRQIKWNCNTCTYLNESYSTQCEMCGTPKG